MIKLSDSFVAWLRTKGMDFCLWLITVNNKILDVFARLFKRDEGDYDISVIINIYWFAEDNIWRLYSFFYTGSREEVRDALNLWMDEEITHYNSFQQQLIRAFGLLEAHT
jgi:hypothetical protein